MTFRTRWGLLIALLVVFTLTMLLAGQRAQPPPVTGVERLGPDSGELVADYLQRAAGSFPPPGGGEVWGLVQLGDYLDPAAAAQEMRGARLSSVVLRVPLPGVQTALIFQDLPGQHPAVELAGAMRAAAQERAQAAGQAPPGSRRAAVATAEAARLRAGCTCVLAVLVRADGAVLRDLASRVGVRAVQAAHPGTPREDVAVSPLLPEQRDTVGPVSDEGPVPP
ncbi:MAG TPA: hypothetical protein VGJ13_07710 [Pseudonocardiaceae bacterium]